MNQTVDETEDRAQEQIRMTKRLESENSNLRHEMQTLQDQLENYEQFNSNAQRAFESARDTFNQEKRDLIDRMEREKIEWCDRQHGHYQMKINSLKSLNDQLNQRLITVKKTEEELLIVSDELAAAKMSNQTIRQDFEVLSKQLAQTENYKQSLQSELKTTQNNLVDNIESERNRLDDRLIQLEMSNKVKDEKIMAQRNEIKILEKKMQTKLSEMSA